MGAYVREHVRERNAILTDDAYTFPIMLFSGRPDVFVDHVDRGDRYWSSVLAGPFGVVRYVLVYTGPANDRINARYPRIHSGMQPGFTVVHRVGPYFLARVALRPPA